MTQYGLKPKKEPEKIKKLKKDLDKDVKPDEKSVGDFKVSSTGHGFEKEMIRMNENPDMMERRDKKFKIKLDK